MAIQLGGSGLKELPPLLRSRGARWGALATFSAALWLYVFLGDDGLGRQRDFLERRASLARQLAQELAENASIRSEVEALRTDDLAIEAAVRDQLGYQRPGEIVELVGQRDPLGGRDRAPAGAGGRPRFSVPPLPDRLKPKPRPAPKASAATSSAPAKPSAGSNKSVNTKAPLANSPSAMPVR